MLYFAGANIIIKGGNYDQKLSESSLLLTQEELQKHILGMTLFNDLLARAVLEDKEACEHILRILTGIKTLVIKKNKTQYVISKLSSHNIIMDVLAEDANNKLYEIEIQKADGGIAHEKRMLYYASTIINEYFFKGDQTYASVPELHIFISARQISGSLVKPATLF